MKAIKTRREKAGLSQAQLAKRLGTTQQAVSQWESGERNIKVTQLYRLAKALGCEAADLL